MLVASALGCVQARGWASFQEADAKQRHDVGPAHEDPPDHLAHAAVAPFRQPDGSVRVDNANFDDRSELQICCGREQEARTADIACPAEMPFRLLGSAELHHVIEYDARLNRPTLIGLHDQP